MGPLVIQLTWEGKMALLILELDEIFDTFFSISIHVVHLIPKWSPFNVLSFAWKLALVALFKGKYSFEFLV